MVLQWDSTIILAPVVSCYHNSFQHTRNMEDITQLCIDQNDRIVDVLYQSCITGTTGVQRSEYMLISNERSWYVLIMAAEVQAKHYSCVQLYTRHAKAGELADLPQLHTRLIVLCLLNAMLITIQCVVSHAWCHVGYVRNTSGRWIYRTTRVAEHNNPSKLSIKKHTLCLCELA